MVVREGVLRIMLAIAVVLVIALAMYAPHREADQISTTYTNSSVGYTTTITEKVYIVPTTIYINATAAAETDTHVESEGPDLYRLALAIGTLIASVVVLVMSAIAFITNIKELTR